MPVPPSTSRIPLLLLMLVACVSPDQGKDSNAEGLTEPADLPAAASIETTPARTKAALPIGESIQARPILYSSLGSGSETIFLLAAIHGNEDAGAPLLEMFITHLRSNPKLLAGKRVIILPTANPDGRKSRRRGNANGIDLNRNFDSKNFTSGFRHGNEPLSEPESRAILKLLARYKPARVISIHQPLKVIDFDGPASALAQRVSQASGLPVKQLGSRPGSLGSFVGVDLGIPILTVELPRGVERLEDQVLWQRYGDLLLAAIGD